MSNLELRIDESSDLSFDAVDFVGVPFAPTVEVEEIEGGHRVSITSMGAEGKKTDEFDVMDGATWLSGNILIGELAEGTVLTADDAYAAPPKSVGVFGKSTQSGMPTPDAPVEINSVDDLTLNVCGFNQWDEEWEVGSLNANGEKTLSTTTIRSKNYVPVLPSVTYYAIVLNDGAIGRMCFYDAAKAHIANADIVIQAGGRVFTMPVGTRYLRFVAAASYGATYNHDICINISDTSRNGTYAPYQGASVSIPLSDHVGRSLPDGTEDELTLSYVGPSTEHDGWGVFSKVLTQRVGVATINASEWQNENAVLIGDGWYRTVKNLLRGAESVAAATATQGMCTAAPFVYNATLKSEHVGTQNIYVLLVAQESTAAAIAAKYDGATVLYKLATPVTHDLGTVELPILPNPMTAWADGGSAQPTLSMVYERALSIVIPRIEAQLADMATS